MKLLRIDEQGLFIEDVIVDKIPTIIVDEVEVNDPLYIQETPVGFYLPKWSGSEWVEGKTQAEIDTIVNVVQPPNQSDRIKQLENTMLGLMDFMMGGL